MRTSSTKPSRFTLHASLFTLLFLCGLAPELQAATGTNKQAAGTTDYWTNNAAWTGASYPGSAGSETACLATNMTGSYTNILDATLPNTTLVALSISNVSGTATLIATNTTFTSTTLNLGTGGRLQLDNLATQTLATLNLNGLDPTITINDGATLSMGGAGAHINLFNGLSGTTALVVRATSGGAGSLWDVSGRQLFIGRSNSAFNVMTINGGGAVGGLVVTNVGISGGAIGALNIGDVNVVSNRLNLINGVRLTSLGALRISNTVTSRYNVVTVDDSTLILGQHVSVGLTLTNSGNSLVVTNGGLVSAVGMYVGNATDATAGSSNNMVTVVGTNSSGSRSTIDLNLGLLSIAQADKAFSNRVVVDYGMITNIGRVKMACSTVGGAPSANYNMLAVTNGGFLSVTGLVQIAGIGTTGNVLWIDGGFVSVGGDVQIGGTTTSTGNTLRINGGAMTNLSLTAYTNNPVFFTAGTLAMGSATYNDGLFIVGDGIQTATLIALDSLGTLDFSGGMLISSNATLRGVGTIKNRAVGSAALTITNGAILTPGLTGPVLFTVSTNMVWSGGGEFQCDITDVAGGVGVGWDSLSMAGSLTLADAGANKLRITLNSMETDTANFNPAQNYSLKIASCGSVVDFTASDFEISTNNFLPVSDGTWTVANFENGLYLVYTASGSAAPTADYTWIVPTSGYWGDANWVGGIPTDNGNPVWNLTFGGDSTRYGSTNNLAGTFQLSNMVFNSDTPNVTNLIAGNPIEFGGEGGGIQQWGSGSFQVSNSINLAASMTFSGPGLGTVFLHTNITGVGGLTKLDSGKLVLQGSNTFNGPVLVNGNGMLRADHAKALGVNSVTVSNGTLFVNSGATTVLELGQPGAASRAALVTGSGSLWTNVAILKVSTNTSFNTLTIANTGRLYNAAAVSFVGDNASSNTAVVKDGGLWSLGASILTVGRGAATGNVLRVEGSGVVTNAPIYVGDSGGQMNSLVVTNGGRVYSSASMIGNSSSNNTALVKDNGYWNLGGLALYVGNGGAIGNTLTVDGGMVTNTGVTGLFVGRVNTLGATGNGLLITNGGQVAATAFYAGSGSSNNYTIVEGSNSAGRATLSSTALNLGDSAGARGNWIRVGSGGYLLASTSITLAGLGDNSLLVTNGGVVGVAANGAPVAIGSASSNNYVIVSGSNEVGRSTLLGYGTTGIGLTIGDGATGNWMRVEDGALATNVNAVTVGNGVKAQYNTLTITNGGQLYSRADSPIGTSSASNNTVVIAGASGGQSALWEALGKNITIGSGTGTGNVLRVGDGGVLSNAVLAFSTPTPNNSVMVESGGAAYAGIIVGSAASYVTNPLITLPDGSASIWVPGSQAWTGNGLGLTVGSAAGANSNYATINNRIFTNFGALTLGGGWNTLMVTNGGLLHSTGAVSLGPNDSADFNQLIVAGGAGVTSVWNAGNAAVNGSLGGAANNDALVVDGRGALGSAVATNLSSLNIGYQFLGSPYGVSNSVTVTNGGMLYVGSSGITGSSYSRLEVVQGGQLNTVGGITIATLGGKYCEMIVRDPGSLLKGQNISITVGINGANSNRLEISNYGVVSNATVYVATTAAQNGNMLNNVLTITGGGKLYGYSGGANAIGLSETHASRASYWSTGNVSGAESLWDLKTGALTVGSGGMSNGMVVCDGGTVTNGGTLNVGAPSAGTGGQWYPAIFNRMFITNGGRVFCTAGNIGLVGSGNGPSNSNRVDVLDSMSLWDLGGGALTIGATSDTNNVLTIDRGGTVDNIGTLTINSSNAVVLNGGTLGVSNVTVGSGPIIQVGDGTQTALLKALGGSLRFANGLLISSNAALQGTGLVNGGVPGIVVTNGGRFSPGVNNPGLLTVSNLTWHGGATFQCEITNFGMAGVGYDQLAISNATLTLGGDTDSSNLIIRLDSLGTAAANFSSNADYNLCVVNGGTISGFDATKFKVDVSAFSNAYSGTWGVMTNNGNLYVTYRATTFAGLDYTWAAPNNGNWDVDGNWTNPVAPAPNSPGTSLRFGGAVADAAYAATNNNTPGAFLLNKLVLTNNNPNVTNRLAGNPLEFGYDGAGIEQWGVGGFGISNRLDLTTNFTFSGTGSGVVLVGSNITGVGSITKQGSYTVVLQLFNSFVGPVVVDGVGGTLQVNNAMGLGQQNAVTVSNGTLLANLALAWSNRNALVTGSGSFWTNSGALTVGTNAQMTVDNGGLLRVVGALTVGDSGTVTNSLTVTNGGSVYSSALSYIGNASSNNSALVIGSGSQWTGAGGLTIGSGAAATGNVLTVNGGMVANAALTVGSAAGSGYNRLVVTNGGSVYSTAASYVGGTSSSNSAFLYGPNTLWNMGGTTLSLGSGSGTNNLMIVDGGSVNGGAIVTNVTSLYIGDGNIPVFNQLVVTNGGSIFTTAASGIGSGSAGYGNSNSVYIYGGSATSVWNAGGGALTVGYGYSSLTATGNVLRIDGLGVAGSAMVTNVGALAVGKRSSLASPKSSSGNSLIVTNGGYLFSGDISVGPGSTAPAGDNNLYAIGGGPAGCVVSNGAITIGSGATAAIGNNTMTVTNTDLKSGALILGSITTNNTVSVFGDTLWNMQAGAMTIGSGIAVSNIMTIDKGVVTNVAAVTVGTGAGANRNSLTLTNGGKLYSAGAAILANTAGQTSNSVVVSGSESIWDLGGGSFTIGIAAGTSTGNVLTIDQGATVDNIGTLTINSNNAVIFNSGLLGLTAVTVGQGTLFQAGNGAQSATLKVLGGSCSFTNGLLVNNLATLAGVGTVAGGGPGVVLTNGAILSAGLDGIGTLTLSNTTWYGGATNVVEITDVSGFPGVGYDTVIINTQLTLTAASKTFVVKMDSLTTTANFQAGQDYWIKIMTCSTSAAPLASSLPDFRVDTTAFVPGGSWWVTNVGYTLYLTTTGVTPLASTHVWDPVKTGNWDTATNWKGGTAPIAGGNPANVLEFGGSGVQSYIATNNLGPDHQLKALRLTSTSTGTNYLLGSSLLYVGSGSGISLEGSGWTTSTNRMNWTVPLLLGGSGVGGGITLSNSLVGTGSVTVAAGGTYVMAVSNAFLGDLLVNCSGNGKLRIDHNNALGSNSVTVSNGTLQVTPTFYLGKTGQGNLQGLVTGSGSIWTNVGSFVLGTNSGFNTLTIANTGRMYAAAGTYIGYNAASSNKVVVQGGGRLYPGGLNIGWLSGSSNSLVVTTSGSVYSAGATIGYRATNNTVLVGSGGLWNVGGGLNIGTGNGGGASGNVLRVEDGGVVSNISLLQIGFTTPSQLNGLVITNGGRVYPAGSTYHEFGNGASNNYIIVEGSNSVGPATLSFVGATDSRLYMGKGVSPGNWIRVGSGGLVSFTPASGASGALVGFAGVGNNYVMVTNGGQMISGNAGTPAYDSRIGNSSSNNYVIVTGSNVNQASTWNGGGSPLGIGNNGTGNWMQVENGGMVTNFGVVTLGEAATDSGNSLTLTNGGRFYVTGLTMASGNSARLNGVGVSANGLLNGNNYPISIGTGLTTLSNSLTVGVGGIVTNVGTLQVGNTSSSNQLYLSGGSLSVSNLVCSNVNNTITFSAGALNLRGAYVSNTVPLVVGDGAQSAILSLGPVGKTNIFADGLTISSKATLTGVGTILGATTVYGTNSPGVEGIGVITNRGDVTLTASAVSRIEIGANTTPGVGWDLLAVTNGTLTVGGKLIPILTGGFTPSNTMSFVIMTNFTASGVSGSFANEANGKVNVFTNDSQTVIAGTFDVVVSNSQYVVLYDFKPPLASGTVFKFR